MWLLKKYTDVRDGTALSCDHVVVGKTTFLAVRRFKIIVSGKSLNSFSCELLKCTVSQHSYGIGHNLCMPINLIVFVPRFLGVIKKLLPFLSLIRSTLNLGSENLGTHNTIVLSIFCFRFHLQPIKPFSCLFVFVCQTVKPIPAAAVIFNEKIGDILACLSTLLPTRFKT